MTILDDMGIQQWRLRRSVDQNLAIDASAESAEVSNSLLDKVKISSNDNAADLSVSAGSDEFSKPMSPKLSEPESGSADFLGKNKSVETPSILPVNTSATSESLRNKKPQSSLLNDSVEEQKKPDNQNSSNSKHREKTSDSSQLVDKKIPLPMPAPVSSVIPAPAPAPINMDANNVSVEQGVSVQATESESIPVTSYDQRDFENVDAYHDDTQPESTKPGTAVEFEGLGWSDLQAIVDGWQNCPSCGEHKSLLGSGNVNADWLFLSDAPNSHEVEQQALFTGRSGQLFEAMLSALGLNRMSVYNTSIFKCMASDDVSIVPTCNNIVQRQIQLVKPKVIISFGEFASQALLRANANLDVLRTQEQRCLHSKLAVIPTYTPAQMLDDARLKSAVWSDLKKAIVIANLPE